MKELRDRRLYRSTHKTFEEYCLDRFGMKRAHSYRLIDAALVVENLSAKCPPLGDNLLEAPTENQMSPIGRQKSLRDDWVTSGRQILPTSERQVRPLSSLEPDQQCEVWQQAVSSAGGKVPLLSNRQRYRTANQRENSCAKSLPSGGSLPAHCSRQSRTEG